MQNQGKCSNDTETSPLHRPRLSHTQRAVARCIGREVTLHLNEHYIAVEVHC